MKTFLAYRGGEVDEVAALAEVHALLRAVAEEVGKMEHSKDCDCIPDPADFLDRPEDLCNCPKSRALALTKAAISQITAETEEIIGGN